MDNLQLQRNVILAAGLMALAGSSMAQVLDFEGRQHGEVLRDLNDGIRVTGINRGDGPSIAAAFDTTRRFTRDLQLQGPNALGESWSGGNISDESLGNVMIVNANNTDGRSGVLSDPVAEDARPGARIHFNTGMNIASFGLDLIDVDGNREFKGGYIMGVYFEPDGSRTRVTVPFAWLETRRSDDATLSAIYDRQVGIDGQVEFGSNTANRITSIQASDFGLPWFDRVVVGLGGSSAIDNVTFSEAAAPSATAVPNPAAAVAGVFMMGVLTVKRRRREV